MIETLVLIFSFLLVLLVIAIVCRSIINKQSIIGRPPIPVFFFILAKMFVVVNLVFLFLRGLNISVHRIFEPELWIDLTALAFLITGTIILILTTIRLNKDLIFGLSSSGTHELQTKGVFSISRHPFYLGFLMILFASCLLNPNVINAVAFPGAWIIHHFIMIKEEEYLVSQYGDQYRQYMKKVKRYITSPL
jgi:protein-S-isoprenylcysteine O-methyltransferase Ste14